VVMANSRAFSRVSCSIISFLQPGQYTAAVTAENWPEILLRRDVRLGTVDPDQAPIGYRTLAVWRLASARTGRQGLAERLRARCAPEHVAPHESELLQLLQSRAIDYAFVYRSTAEEHNLKVVILPDSENLGSVAHSTDYARVSVNARMRARHPRAGVPGAPLIYGLTVPEAAPHPKAALRFVAALLGVQGRRTLERTGFRPLVPPRVHPGDRLPASLQALVK